ncbi:MAG: hypothetical protein AVDCRST_MAG64-202 [uncultured Phycisphaerae bacterium]|uniref:Uncharacterized protein n=1 Tax=uncultured Phycisphaerae bacterium TaxID=904963 RepID=A0A6J4N4Q9_9BACT|nr:MAG: hypothetical protein AVDCRST_MAG64-202 [uncultured Phycisphaerae bacterium]
MPVGVTILQEHWRNSASISCPIRAIRGSPSAVFPVRALRAFVVKMHVE